MCSAVETLSESFPRGHDEVFNYGVMSSVIEAFNGIRLFRSPGEKKDVFSTTEVTIQFGFRRKVHANVLRFLDDDSCPLFDSREEETNPNG